MRNKLCALLLAGLTFLLAGCSLARPEAEDQQQDRFCGFYMVYSSTYDDGFYDNPHLTELGTDTLDTGEYGSVSFPRQVLMFDWESRSFPGLEGYALFTYRGTEENGSLYYGCVSDMGEAKFNTAVTDLGGKDEIEGAVYMGPPLGEENWDPNQNQGYWRAYRVYQTKDGAVYLDGSGNSYSGAGGMSTTETAAYTSTKNGETVLEDTVSATVHIEVVPRLESLTVIQYDDGGGEVCRGGIPLGKELPAVTPERDTAWLLVEERYGDGTVKRTAYSVQEESVLHSVVILDDRGAGESASLEIMGTGAK